MIQIKTLKTTTGDIKKVTLSNAQETAITVTNLGASLLQFLTKDKHHHLQDIVLGFDDIEAYFDNRDSYLGATVGRVANRTEHASFTLNDQVFQIPNNEGNNNLHSGPDGYQIRIWDIKETDSKNNHVTFTLDSPDGDQGYPGHLSLDVTYHLTDDNQLIISYKATSDKATPFSPTNHSYFNLNGHQAGHIDNHLLQLNATAYTPLKDEHSIPSGEICTVKGTPFDFTKPKAIGRDINHHFDQLTIANGYDHNFVISEPSLKAPFARVVGDQSGIVLEVFTNLPGVQFYTGNFLNNIPGKNQTTYGKRQGFCLETQHFPNAINIPNFPSPVLEANTTTIYQTIYKVSCDN